MSFEIKNSLPILLKLLFLCITAHIQADENQHTGNEITFNTTKTHNFIDWFDSNSIDANKSFDLKHCGKFIEPDLTIFDDSDDILSSPLKITADSSGDSSEEEAILNGNVEITQGQRLLRSDSAKINNKSNQVSLVGNIVFREPGIAIASDRAEISLDSKEITMKNAQYVIHGPSLNGTAETLKRGNNGEFIVENATYSNCQPGDSGWNFVTSKITINENEGYASINKANLKVNGSTIFYFPYLKLPISSERMTGLLIPDLDISQTNGLDYTQPLYFNFAPNFDTLFSPRYVENRGFGFNIKMRHLNKWSRNELTGSIIFDDKNINESYPANTSSFSSSQNRYEIAFSHIGHSSDQLISYIDYTKTSDALYIKDLGNFTIDEITLSHLNQFSYLEYQNNNWLYKISTTDFQSIVERYSDHYSALPSIEIIGAYRFNNNLNIRLTNKFTNFQHKSDNQLEGTRTALNYSIDWIKFTDWGYLKPEFHLSHLSYNLDNADNSLVSDKTLTLPTLVLKGGISLEKFINPQSLATIDAEMFYQNSRAKIQNDLPIFDTRERTLSYDSLFKKDRFVGSDRVSNEERITIGVTSKLINFDSLDEKFVFQAARSYFLDDEIMYLTQPSTPTLKGNRNKAINAFKIKAYFNENWELEASSIKSNLQKSRTKNIVNLRYNRDDDSLFNLSYRKSGDLSNNEFSYHLTQEIEQLDFSIRTSLSNKVNFVGRWYHDLSNQRELEIFGGVEYSSCCWSMAVLARRSINVVFNGLDTEIDPNMRNSIIFKLELKGIGSTGQKLDKILKKGIFGY